PERCLCDHSSREQHDCYTHGRVREQARAECAEAAYHHLAESVYARRRSGNVRTLGDGLRKRYRTGSAYAYREEKHACERRTNAERVGKHHEKKCQRGEQAEQI